MNSTILGVVQLASLKFELIFHSKFYIRVHLLVIFLFALLTLSLSLFLLEFMSGGSVYDYLHKQRGVFKLPTLIKVAIDISKGMNYLHQNNIIHRDLKAANLLMDENEVRSYLEHIHSVINLLS